MILDFFAPSSMQGQEKDLSAPISEATDPAADLLLVLVLIFFATFFL